MSTYVVSVTLDAPDIGSALGFVYLALEEWGAATSEVTAYRVSDE